jgi:hypothetical protein
MTTACGKSPDAFEDPSDMIPSRAASPLRFCTCRALSVEKGAVSLVVRTLTVLPDHYRLVHAG